MRTEHAARGFAAGPSFNPDCPCPRCSGPIADGARAGLESLMRRGGRRAHRLRVAVDELDDRFRAATVEAERWQSQSCWERREVDWER